MSTFDPKAFTAWFKRCFGDREWFHDNPRIDFRKAVIAAVEAGSVQDHVQDAIALGFGSAQAEYGE